MSSIPGHTPNRPPLSPGRRLFILSLAFLPVVGYTVLRVRANRISEQNRLDEEEGRNRFLETQNEKDALKDLSVVVGRSGGGV